MRVLIVSANKFKKPMPAFPIGAAYVSGAAVAAGHQVSVFDCCIAGKMRAELEACVRDFQPEVIGISIRNVHSGVMMDHQDFRPEVKEVVDVVKGQSTAPIVVGGAGFDNFAADWLDYLDLGYGIRGEAEISLPLYLRYMEEGGDLGAIPGCIYKDGSGVREVPRVVIKDLDSTPLPAFDLFDLEGYAALRAFPGIISKRGCGFRCSYCPTPSLEGTRYRLKSPGRVVREFEMIEDSGSVDMVYFTDNVFNFPKKHAEAICRELIGRDTGTRWTTDSFRPKGMDEDFCRLIKESGCMSVNLAVESASPSMLEHMNRSYGQEDIEEAARSLDRVGLPYSVTLLLGAPGETPDTVEETLGFVDSLSNKQAVLATIGLSLEYHQRILEDARRDGQLNDDSQLFEGVHYLSPGLSKGYVDDLAESIRERPNWALNEA